HELRRLIKLMHVLDQDGKHAELVRLMRRFFRNEVQTYREAMWLCKWFLRVQKWAQELKARGFKILPEALPEALVENIRQLHQASSEFLRGRGQLKPLTAVQSVVLSIIKLSINKQQPGISGNEICKSLRRQMRPIDMGESTLTRHIIPALRPYGVR